MGEGRRDDVGGATGTASRPAAEDARRPLVGTAEGPLCLTTVDALGGRAGSGEFDVSELAAWLHAQQWPVEMVAGRRLATADTGGVPVELLQAWGEKRWPNGLDGVSASVAGLSFRLRRLHPWLVHAFAYNDCVAAAMAERPYVLSVPDLPAPEGFTGRPALWRLFSMACDGARAVISPSRSGAAHLQALYGISARVVPNGIDVSRYAAIAATRAPGLILAVLGDEPKRQAELAVDAFGQVARDVGQAELVVVGADESARPELERRLPARLRTRLRLTGTVDRARMLALYARASVTCLCSGPDAFAQPLLESLAAGTPAVGVQAGGVPELVTGDIGATFTMDDAASCARALGEVLDRATEHDLAAPCRSRAADYDWSVVGPQLLALYREVA